MESFIEIIVLLGFALVSILANERARAKRMQAQREMRPPSVDEPVEVSAEERSPAQEMLQRLQAHASAFGIEGAGVVSAPHPPPILLEEPAAEEPVEVAERAAPVLRQVPSIGPVLGQFAPLLPTGQISPGTSQARGAPSALLATIRTRAGLRRALLMREILGPPRAFEQHGRI